MSSQTSPDLSNASPNASASKKTRRQASTREPVQSFAYGAQEDPNQKRQSIGNTSANGLLKSLNSSGTPENLNNGAEASSSSNEPALRQSHAQDAKTRYSNLKERQRRRSRTPSATPAKQLPLSTTDSPRRSKRLSESGSQDGGMGLPTSNSALVLRQNIETIEEDQAVEEPRPPPLPSSRSRSNFSPGIARSHASGSGSGNVGIGAGRNSGGLGHLSSFYLSRQDSVTSKDIEQPHDITRMLAPSLLRGAQKPSHDPMAPGEGMDMLSFRSSELADSRSNDYEEDSAVARQYDQQFSPTPPISSSSHGWSSNRFGAHEQGRNGSRTSLGQQRRGRVSDENKAYRPSAGEESEDSETDLSAEERKHGHRKKKQTSRSTARDGRDDNEIWKTKKRKGRSSKTGLQDGEEDQGEQEESPALGGEDDETLDVPTDADTTAENSRNRKGSQSARKSRSSPTKKRQTSQQLSPSNEALDQTTRPHLSRYLWAIIGVAMTAILFRALNGSSKTFDLSDASAGTTADFAQRLFDVEKRLTSSFSTLDQKIAGLGKSTSSRLEELGKESKGTAASLQRLEKALDVSRSGLEVRIQRAESDIQRVERERQNLQDAIKSLEQRKMGEDSASDTKRFEKKLSTLQDRLDRSEASLSQLKDALERTTKLADKAQEGLAMLEKKLPEHIAVRTDRKTGQPVLDASFLAMLRAIFAEKGSEASTQASSKPAVSSWNAFLAENRERLRALMVETVDGGFVTRAEQGAILDRESFTQLLGRELKSAKRTLEERFNENFSTMQSNIEANLKHSAPKPTRKSSGAQMSKVSTDSPSWAHDYLSTMIGDQNNNVTAGDAVVALIQTALDKYSADRTGKPDFALATAGGRIIPSLTSPTFADVRARAPSWLPSLFGAGSLSPSSIVNRVPHLAIHHDTSQGMCWPFAGEEGQLGIGLSRKVIVTDVTLDHLPLEVAYGQDRSAPRDVTVWGLVERREDLVKLKAYRANKSALRMQELDSTAREDGEDMMLDPAPAPPAANHLLLSTFTYDIARGAGAVQTFPASMEAQQLRIPIQIVKVHFTSNHGNRQFTCVYRIRIHGEEWSA